MAIILAGTTLNPNMVWMERYAFSPVLQDVQMTLGGATVIYTAQRQEARPITLLALEDQGWLTKAMADAVQTSANQEGAVVTLVLGSDSYQVVFNHHNPPAVDLRPLLTRAVPLDGDYFVGEIKLMTV